MVNQTAMTRINQLPEEYRLPDQLPNIRYVAQKKGIKKAVRCQYLAKHYVQTHAAAIKEELGFTLHTNMDVVFPGNNISRTDYWGYWYGRLLNIEIEYELYGLKDHEHKVARFEEVKPEHVDVVHLVFACVNGEERPHLDKETVEVILDTPVFVAEDIPKLPDFREFRANVEQSLIAEGFPLTKEDAPFVA